MVSLSSVVVYVSLNRIFKVYRMQILDVVQTESHIGLTKAYSVANQ